MDKRYQVLDLCYTFQNMQQNFHPVVLFGNRDVVLVDLRLSRFFEVVTERALKIPYSTRKHHKIAADAPGR